MNYNNPDVEEFMLKAIESCEAKHYLTYIAMVDD